MREPQTVVSRTGSAETGLSQPRVRPLGLQPDRAAEGAAGPPEGHGGDAAVPPGRYAPRGALGGSTELQANPRMMLETLETLTVCCI